MLGSKLILADVGHVDELWQLSLIGDVVVGSVEHFKLGLALIVLHIEDLATVFEVGLNQAFDFDLAVGVRDHSDEFSATTHVFNRHSTELVKRRRRLVVVEPLTVALWVVLWLWTLLGARVESDLTHRDFPFSKSGINLAWLQDAFL